MADDTFAEMTRLIRREIDKVKAEAKACGWHPSTNAWHRAFGQIAGMHKILQLVDRDGAIYLGCASDVRCVQRRRLLWRDDHVHQVGPAAVA